MALEIMWSKKAERKFDKIVEYLDSNWDETVAISFIIKTFNFLRVVANFPEVGMIQNEDKGIRGFTLIKQINIFYQTTSDKIIILDFFDNRQKPENITKSNLQEEPAPYITPFH